MTLGRGRSGIPAPYSLPAALAALFAAGTGLPLLTLLLVAARAQLNPSDDLLLFLLAVVTVTVVGGFWPTVLAAVASSLLLNWYLTPPPHTFTIQEPRNLLALVLFVTVAVAVTSVVHLAARRAVQAAASREETASLLALARNGRAGRAAGAGRPRPDGEFGAGRPAAGPRRSRPAGTGAGQQLLQRAPALAVVAAPGPCAGSWNRSRRARSICSPSPA